MKKKKNDIPVGIATVFAAIITASSSFLICNSNSNNMSINKNNDVQESKNIPSNTFNEKCMEIKNLSAFLYQELEFEKSMYDDLDEKKIDFLYYRDEMLNVTKFECSKIKEDLNEITKLISSAQETLKND